MSTQRVATDRITALRFKEWRQVLRRDHCTPAMLISIGHDEHSGEMHLLVPEDVPMPWLRSWLQAALEHLPPSG